MYFEYRPKTGNPLIDKLIEQTTDEQREIQHLNQEVQTIRATIQSKQNRVNKINLRIAQVRERQNYLRPIRSPDNLAPLLTREDNYETRNHTPNHLVCLQGGKS